MLYQAIPVFRIFENIQRDYSFEVLLKFCHLIPFPSVHCKIYFLTVDLIGSKSEINIDTKKHNHVDIMCFSIITESIRNFYFCRWLLLVRTIFNFRPRDFRESLPPLFNLFKEVSIPTAIKRKAYNKCRKLNLKHQS